MVTVQAGFLGNYFRAFGQERELVWGFGCTYSARQSVCIMASDTFGVLIISAKIPFDAFNIIRGDVHGRE